MIADPGTAMVAGGNEVHAGPATTGPRMFTFAIGVPDDDGVDVGMEGDDRYNKGEDNDGEVQYCPALLHLDLCCILFGMIEQEYMGRSAEERNECKRFLLEILVEFVTEYPTERYCQNLCDRLDLQNWISRICDALENQLSLNGLLQEAFRSKTLSYG